MAIGNYDIARFQSAIQVSNLPSQDQQNPVYNNNSNSAADNNCQIRQRVIALAHQQILAIVELAKVHTSRLHRNLIFFQSTFA